MAAPVLFALSISEALELPFFSDLVRAARQRPEAYQPRAGAGFLAVRANSTVAEIFFGPRGGIVRQRTVGVVRSA